MENRCDHVPTRYDDRCGLPYHALIVRDILQHHVHYDRVKCVGWQRQDAGILLLVDDAQWFTPLALQAEGVEPLGRFHARNARATAS
jgi:hypothetical protein